MPLKLHMSVRSAVLVAVMATLMIGSSFLASTMAASTKMVPVARSACHHIHPSESSSPCIIGNIIVECGYAFGSCESSRYLKCKLSADLGKVVKFKLTEGLEGTRVENPHKTVTCKGSAMILKLYIWKHVRTPYVWQLVRAHGAHSLAVTLYPKRNDQGLLVLAQH